MVRGRAQAEPERRRREHRPRRVLLLHEPARPGRPPDGGVAAHRPAPHEDAAQPRHRQGLRQTGPRRGRCRVGSGRQDRARQPGSAGGPAFAREPAGRASRRLACPSAGHAGSHANPEARRPRQLTGRSPAHAGAIPHLGVAGARRLAGPADAVRRHRPGRVGAACAARGTAGEGRVDGPRSRCAGPSCCHRGPSR
ncbi:MAG: hypothetical protein MZU84_04730 [Sphingobacterium sp.]|nr:hypothetical protein [Sphingobacterium sp.]